MLSLPQLTFSNISRQNVLNYFENTWNLTEVLFSGLASEEAFISEPAHGLRHPLVFYYAHPAILYVNKLRVAGIIDAPINDYFEKIFEVGVDEMSWDDMSKNQMRWPSVKEVQGYRIEVYALIKNLILTHPDLEPNSTNYNINGKAWALVMGFEHERIHLETSSVLIRELPLKFVKTPPTWPALKLQSEKNENFELKLLDFKGQQVQLGKPLNFPSYGWDNEYGSRSLDVPNFKAENQLVSNERFLEFVIDGGYRHSKYWSADGWNWKNFRNAKWPTFWVQDGPAGLNQFKIRTIFEEVAFQPTWPAVVNFHEAQAFCRWKTEKDNQSIPYRLLSEAEHHVLRTQTDSKAKWNLHLVHGSEVSVSTYTSNGLSDVFGNTWSWCEDQFNPLNDFKPHPYYEDFSTPCFDGRHQMIMGGSFVSTGDEATSFARFHFRPHFFQHAGFRIAQSISFDAKPTAFKFKSSLQDYESNDLLAQYLLLHFAKHSDILPYKFAPTDALDFPKRCADAVIENCERLSIPKNSVLDLGCAVGGSSFYLSSVFEKTVGIDLSHSFISAANQLKICGEISFERKNQGYISTKLEVFKPAAARSEKINFIQGDACNLPNNLNNFDAVLMANLLCRLPDPAGCLRSTANLINQGGLLVLVSPYSWLEQYTEKHKWLGAGFDGSRLSSAEAIYKILSPTFKLIKTDDMPLIIREHERKFQYIVSHLMVWQKN